MLAYQAKLSESTQSSENWGCTSDRIKFNVYNNLPKSGLITQKWTNKKKYPVQITSFENLDPDISESKVPLNCVPKTSLTKNASYKKTQYFMIL